MMRLWKVEIREYYFEISYYNLFVLSDTEKNMLRTVHQHFITNCKDVESKIIKYEEINLKEHINRVL